MRRIAEAHDHSGHLFAFLISSFSRLSTFAQAHDHPEHLFARILSISPPQLPPHLTATHPETLKSDRRIVPVLANT